MTKETKMELLEMLIGGNSATNTLKTGYEKYMGKNVFIRTVTHHYTGRVIDIDSLSLTLERAAWIADDGRLNEFVREPNKAKEVEPFNGPVTINLYSLCDITEIPYLLEKVK